MTQSGGGKGTVPVPTYELGAGCSVDGRCGEYIRCLECNRISYQPQDVADLWCGRCRKFHEEPELERTG